MVTTKTFVVPTKGFCDVKDITQTVAAAAAESGLTQGTVTVFIPGATGGVTTIEYEPGAVKDFQDLMERLIPSGTFYHHNERWGDGNGFSHARAALIGPSMTVPFMDGHLLMGTWQQIVLTCFDNRPRQRKVVLQLQGE